ncbi:MAG: hypothetical protein HONDAALG_01059 [Gammaproteobacteria bacterium]|nr:hypothetical protein [Gammaproteobacteria bacterium]
MKRKRGVVFGAAFKCDLEFAAHVLVELVAHEVAKQRLRVWINVEGFGVRNPGAVTGRDVAHSVAAGFARRDAHFGQFAHQRRRVLKQQVVKLRILARREVDETAGVTVGGVGQSRQLVGGQVSAGNLDALHLDALLPLGVSAELQPQLLHLGFAHFACAVFFDLLFVMRQFILDEFGNELGWRRFQFNGSSLHVSPDLVNK